MKTKQLSIYFFILLLVACNQSENHYHLPIPKVLHYIQSDTLLLGKKEQIHLLSFNSNDVILDIVYTPSSLLKTSTLAKMNNAIGAINGSFFDRDKGGSVVYVERNNQVISYKDKSNSEWTKPDSLINGIIIFTKNKKLKIEKLKDESYYSVSDKEQFAMASGAILLLDSVVQQIPKMDFCTLKHPRTCIAKRKDNVLFLVIDGRSFHSEGINLNEIQQYLLNLGYTDAINLDGGGSSTMWIKNKGGVNSPSDGRGERVVANALIIKEK